MLVQKCLNCNGKKLEVVGKRIDDNAILECQDCLIMMVAEVSDNTEDLYTSEYYEKDNNTKSGYTDYLALPVANLIGKFGLAKLFLSTNGDHLDLGSADGSLMELFEANGFKTIGLEISQDAVSLAREKGLEAYVSNLHTFPKLKNKFKVVTAFDLLEHSDKPGKVLDGVVEILEDDGYFVFSTLSVNITNPKDYWLNNSLEHYVYYTKDNLSNMLAQKFGKHNFDFVEIINNGIAEFWGVAKTSSFSKRDRSIFNILRNRGYGKLKPESALYLSFFYDQVSMFKESKSIIREYEKKWSKVDYVQSVFFYNYFQGHFNKAIQLTNKLNKFIPIKASYYWQALADANYQYSQIGIGGYKDKLIKTEKLLTDANTIIGEYATVNKQLVNDNREFIKKPLRYTRILISTHKTTVANKIRKIRNH